MLRSLLGLLACLTLAGCTSATNASGRGELVPEEVAPGVYAFLGARQEIAPANGGNVANTGFIVGPQGVIVIDTGPNDAHGEQILAAIARVTHKPVVLAINTHPHPENVLGNSAFARRCIPIMARRETIDAMKARCEMCYRNVLGVLGKDAMAGTTIVIPKVNVAGNGEWIAGRQRIELYHFGWGHTEGDLAVFDPASGVLFTSDLVYLDRVPHMHEARVRRWIGALEKLRTIPARRIVPGRGPISNPERMDETYDYLTQLLARVQAGYDRGQSVIDMLKDPAVDVPQYQGWALYKDVHPLNVQHVYTELEREELVR